MTVATITEVHGLCKGRHKLFYDNFARPSSGLPHRVQMSGRHVQMSNQAGWAVRAAAFLPSSRAPVLTPSGVDGEEVAARPEAVHGVIEERVEPAEPEGQQEQQVDGDAQAEEGGGGIGFEGVRRAPYAAYLVSLRPNCVSGRGVSGGGWGHVVLSFS